MVPDHRWRVVQKVVLGQPCAQPNRLCNQLVEKTTDFLGIPRMHHQRLLRTLDQIPILFTMRPFPTGDRTGLSRTPDSTRCTPVTVQPDSTNLSSQPSRVNLKFLQGGSFFSQHRCTICSKPVAVEKEPLVYFPPVSESVHFFLASESRCFPSELPFCPLPFTWPSLLAFAAIAARLANSS